MPHNLKILLRRAANSVALRFRCSCIVAYTPLRFSRSAVFASAAANFVLCALTALITTSALNGCTRGEVSEEKHDAFVKEMEQRREMKERDRMMYGR